MKLCAVTAFALALVVITPASAKAPPNGYRLCGATRCFLLTGNDAETVAIGALGNMEHQLDTGQPLKPFWTIQWQWNGQPSATAFYVPGAFRWANKWFSIDNVDAQRLLTRAAIDIEPFPPAAPTRVTVGGKAVRDPASYAVLWSAGTTTGAWRNLWIRVRLHTSGPSPWQGTVSVSQRGSLLLRDDTVFKISPNLAARVRARASLR